MKTFILLFFSAVFTAVYAQPANVAYIRIGGTIDPSTGVISGGVTFTNGQTYWVECGTSTLTVSIPIAYPYSAAWTKTSNFSLSQVGIEFIQTLQLDPSKKDGSISAVYVIPPSIPNSPPIPSVVPCVLYIKQLPPPLTVTASNVCPGNSATFSASINYPLQSVRPMSLQWQTTGGVTLNGSSNNITQVTTSGSVTVSNSSSGTFSVRSVVPSCNNALGTPVTGDIGLPTIKNPNYWLFDPGSNMWQFSQISGYPAVTYAFNVTSGSASIIQNYGDAYITTTSGATVCVTPTNNCGAGTPYCFYIPASGGMLRSVSPNPASNDIVIQLNNPDNQDLLPSIINLYEEKSTKIVRSVSLRESSGKNALIEGDKIKILVNDLPRGTYFLHLIPSNESKSAPQKVRVVLQ